MEKKLLEKKYEISSRIDDDNETLILTLGELAVGFGGKYYMGIKKASVPMREWPPDAAPFPARVEAARRWLLEYAELRETRLRQAAEAGPSGWKGVDI